MPAMKPAPKLERAGKGSAGTQNAPPCPVNHLDLFVEGHLVEHQVGALVGREGLVAPWHLRCVRIGLSMRGDVTEGSCADDSEGTTR